MFSILKRDNSLSTKKNLERLKIKVENTSNNFSNKLEKIEKFANTIHEEATKKIMKFKRMAHALDILISDKDKNLNMLLANELQCSIIYGLPNICADKIEGRLEFDVINDYIEKTGKWNSFVEMGNFNIDNIAKESMEKKKFIQIGYVNDKKIILKTTVKPHIENNEFDGILTISNIIDENQLEKLMVKSKLLYNQNNYKVYER